MNSNSEHRLLGSFDEHWDDYRKQLKAGRREVSEDSIHDLRVSARRMQAILSIARGLDNRSPVKKMRRYLRKQLDQLDSLRDTQVMLQEANGAIGSQPEIIPFRDSLQVQMDQLSRAAYKRLRRQKPSDLQPRIKKIRKRVKRHSEDPDLEQRILRSADAAYAKTLARLDRLDAGDPSTVHRVRVAFKKFRYMTEVAQPFLSHYPGDYADKMHDYQDAMGKVHDTQVFLEHLRDFARQVQLERDKQPDLDLQAAEQAYRSRLAALMVAYFQRKDELYSFWRAAPDQPFPWEKSHVAVHRTTRHRGGSGSEQHRGAGQPEAPHERRAQEVPADRPGADQPRNEDRPGADQSVPTGS